MPVTLLAHKTCGNCYNRTNDRWSNEETRRNNIADADVWCGMRPPRPRVHLTQSRYLARLSQSQHLAGDAQPAQLAFHPDSDSRNRDRPQFRRDLWGAGGDALHRQEWRYKQHFGARYYR